MSNCNNHHRSVLNCRLARGLAIGMTLGATKWETELEQGVALVLTTTWARARALGSTVGAIFKAAEVGRIFSSSMGESVRHSPWALLLKAQCVVALLDAHVSHLSPVFSPGVAHDPVLLAAFSAPSDDADDVVDA